MLIANQSVDKTLVTGDVKVTELGFKDGRIRIEVNASTEVTENRDETYQRIQQEKRNQYPESSKQPSNTWFF